MTISMEDYNYLSSREMSFANAEGSLMRCTHQGKTWTWDLNSACTEIMKHFEDHIMPWGDGNSDDCNSRHPLPVDHIETPLTALQIKQAKDRFWYGFCIVIKHTYLSRNLKMINDIIDIKNAVIGQKNKKIENNLCNRIIALILKLFCYDYFAKIKHKYLPTLADELRGGTDITAIIKLSHSKIPLDLTQHLTFAAGTPASEQRFSTAMKKFIQNGGTMSDYCSFTLPGFDFDTAYRATKPPSYVYDALSSYIHGYKKDGLEPSTA